MSSPTSAALPPSADPAHDSRTRLAALVLVAVTLAAWARVLGGDFQYDDHRNVVQDTATVSGDALQARLTTGIRPLLRLSYHFDHRLWGMRPAGFLATALALHVVTVFAVWALARRRLGDPSAALAAGLVFAVQPAHAEVVAYVSGRSTGLMAALLTVSLLCHEIAGTARRPWAWRAAAFAGFAAACLAKEVGLVFPVVLLLWEWTRPGAGRIGRRPVVVALGLAALLAGACALSPRYRMLAAYSVALRGPVESLATNVAALPELLSLWVRPWALSVDHAFAPSGTGLALGVAIAATLVGAVVACRRRAPVAALAAGWVLVALAPTSSIVAKLDPLTEKPLYLAWVGPALLAGSLAAAARRRFGTRAVAVALAALLVAGVVGSGERTAVWSDGRLLWADAAVKAPAKVRPWVNLGVAWLDHDPARAGYALREAVRRDPGDASARRTLMTAEVLCGPGCERRRMTR